MAEQDEGPRGPSCATGCAVATVLGAFAVLLLTGSVALCFGFVDAWTGS